LQLAQLAYSVTVLWLELETNRFPARSMATPGLRGQPRGGPGDGGEERLMTVVPRAYSLIVLLIELATNRTPPMPAALTVTAQ
jgi:hypothetical protein